MPHTPRKRFGQNFLHDTNIIDQIISSIQLEADQHWVEIGPGQGALSKPLLQSGVKLDLIELDRDLVNFLTQQYKNQEKLIIHSNDALKFDYSTLLENNKPLHIIGNLPYNISTPLLFHLLEFANNITEMYFMLQKEVVERICAKPGSKKYGRLSVMLQYYCATEFLFEVPPESFSPIPKVMSAIVKLTPYSTVPEPADKLSDLNTIVTHAFSQRRKTLRNSLKKLLTEQEIAALAITPTLRAEALTLSDFVNLSNFLTQKNQHSPNAAETQETSP